MSLDQTEPTSGTSCRAQSPTGCQAHTRLYRAGELALEGYPVDDISDHLAEPDTVVWLDLLKPSMSDMDVVVEEFGLHLSLIHI